MCFFELPAALDGTALAMVLLAAFLAGMLDAVVGGGGLIQIPALFAALPQVPAATLLGTSKLAGVWGTAVAALRFSRAVRLDWGVVVPAASVAFVFSFVGAIVLTYIPPDLIRKLLPFILAAVAVYTFWRKDLGTHHTPLAQRNREIALAVLFGAAIGFYDGFFGPGTGSFLVFVFVRFLGFDFLRASASAKVINVACNLAALIWFGFGGHMIVLLGLLMAGLNVAGSLVGSRLAIRRGSQFVRKVFLVVIALLVIRTGYDAWLR